MAKLSPETLVYTSAYGARDPIKTSAGTTPSFHLGSDFGPTIRNKQGVILQSIIAGTVTHLSDKAGALGVRTTAKADPQLASMLSRIYGLKVAAGTVVTVSLWHLAKRLVTSGFQAAAGAAIGVMGSTGMSTGVHVHIEFTIGGQRYDPKPFIDAQASKAVADAPDDYYEEDDVALNAEQEAALDWLFKNAAGLSQIIERRSNLDVTFEKSKVAARDSSAALEGQRVLAAQVEQLFIRRGAFDQQGVHIEAILEVVKQQAKSQGVTIDIDAILDEAGKRLSTNTAS